MDIEVSTRESAHVVYKNHDDTFRVYCSDSYIHAIYDNYLYMIFEQDDSTINLRLITECDLMELACESEDEANPNNEKYMGFIQALEDIGFDFSEDELR